MRKLFIAMAGLAIFAAGIMVGGQFDLPPSANSYSPITTQEGELMLPSGYFDVLYNGATVQVQHEAGVGIPVKFAREEKGDESVVYHGLRGR